MLKDASVTFDLKVSINKQAALDEDTEVQTPRIMMHRVHVMLADAECGNELQRTMDAKAERGI